MKRRGKWILLCFFGLCELFFVVVTIPFLFILPPVGFIGVLVSLFFGLIIISIVQSLNGKQGIINLFREGTKTCKKCGFTYERSQAYTCPRCAQAKRNNATSSSFYEEVCEERYRRKLRRNRFWEMIGAGAIVAGLFNIFSKNDHHDQDDFY